MSRARRFVSLLLLLGAFGAGPFAKKAATPAPVPQDPASVAWAPKPSCAVLDHYPRRGRHLGVCALAHHQPLTVVGEYSSARAADIAVTRAYRQAGGR